MPIEGTDKPSLPPTLLRSDEPQPFVVMNPQANDPILLVCDHASRRIPRNLGTMGLDPGARRCHLAWDIGAGELTRQLGQSLGVATVLCEYSRLVIDCNRQLMDPGAFLEFGDGVIIPGNRNLGKSDKVIRANEIYWPYHNAISGQVDRLRQLSVDPSFVSVHSFTPVLNGHSRPWEVGVLWDKDRATAEIFIDGFREAGLLVGDNEPYSGKAPQDFTIDHHAEQINLSHVGIEIRQDLISHADGITRIGAIMHKIIESLPSRTRAAAAIAERLN